MFPLAWHLMLRLDDQRVIAPSTPARRTLARAVHAAGAPRGLLAFRGSDTHVHVLLMCSRAEAGRAAQALACRLRRALDSDICFDRARILPVNHQSHLGNAAEYILRQDQRHGFVTDPLHDASLLPDLLGLRVLGREAVVRFREHLPRLGRTALLDMLGVRSLEPGGDPSFLPDAAAAALGLASLADHRPDTVLARAALVHAADRMRHSEVADLLGGADRKTVRRLRARAVPSVLVQAVCLQAGLKEAIAARGAGHRPSSGGA